MEYGFEDIIETQTNTCVVKDLLEIRGMMLEQGIIIPENLNDTISKELFILSVDTDKTYRSVHAEYTKDAAKHVMATVTKIK